MTKKIISSLFVIILFVSAASAQTAEVRISLNDQFFDAFIDALFKNFNAPEFPIAANDSKFKIQNSKSAVTTFSFADRKANSEDEKAFCSESIRLQREIDGVRTAVRFRDGKIYTPIAFTGSYNPPLVGCVEFQGWAETNINLEYDNQSKKLFGRINVLNVQLSGTGGIGSSVITKFVQNSIDKKVNPIEILQTDKLSFVIPMQNAGGSLKMQAIGVRQEIINGVLNIFIQYQFAKGN